VSLFLLYTLYTPPAPAGFNCLFGSLGALLYYGDYDTPSAAAAAAATGAASTSTGAGVGISSDLGGGSSSSSSSASAVSDVLLLISHSGVVTCVKVFIILDLIFTLPLVLLPARRAIEQESTMPQKIAAWYWHKFGTHPTYMHVQSNSHADTTSVHAHAHADSDAAPIPAYVYANVLRALRVFLVLLAALLAISVRNFASLMTVIGGITCVSVGFILPPLLYVALWRDANVDTDTGISFSGRVHQWRSAVLRAGGWGLFLPLAVSTVYRASVFLSPHVVCTTSPTLTHELNPQSTNPHPLSASHFPLPLRCYYLAPSCCW